MLRILGVGGFVVIGGIAAASEGLFVIAISLSIIEEHHVYTRLLYIVREQQRKRVAEELPKEGNARTSEILGGTDANACALNFNFQESLSVVTQARCEKNKELCRKDIVSITAGTCLRGGRRPSP